MEGLHESFHETFDLKIWAGTDEQIGDWNYGGMKNIPRTEENKKRYIQLFGETYQIIKKL